MLCVSEAAKISSNEHRHAIICAILVAQIICNNMQNFKENYGDTQ